MEVNKVYFGDCMDLAKTVPDDYVDLIVTSPPYADTLSYGKEIPVFHPDNYPEWFLQLATEAGRFLKPTGSFILNINDKIINGRIYTDNVENVAVISENYLLDKISYQQILGELKSASENAVLNKGTSRFKKKYTGRVLSLLQGASGNNYSHWVLEMLPKLRMYSEHYSLHDLNYVYVPRINSFQKETLSVLGINENQLIDSENFRHVQADELFVVDHPYYYHGTILQQNKYLPKWTI